MAKVPVITIRGFNTGRGNLGGRVQFDRVAEPSSGLCGDILDLNTICTSYQIEPDLLIIDIEVNEVLLANYPMQCPASVRYIRMEFKPGLHPCKK